MRLIQRDFYLDKLKEVMGTPDIKVIPSTRSVAANFNKEQVTTNNDPNFRKIMAQSDYVLVDGHIIFNDSEFVRVTADGARLTAWRKSPPLAHGGNDINIMLINHRYREANQNGTE